MAQFKKAVEVGSWRHSRSLGRPKDLDLEWSTPNTFSSGGTELDIVPNSLLPAGSVNKHPVNLAIRPKQSDAGFGERGQDSLSSRP